MRSLAVLAVSLAQPVVAVEGQGVAAGPGYFYPEAGVHLYYDDNILRQATDTVESTVTVASVSGREEIYGNASRYAIEIGFDKGWYHSSQQDNYLDGRLFAEAEYYPTSRVTYIFRGGYWRRHEARGTTVFQGNLATLQEEPDRYDLWKVDAGFNYGLEEVGAPRLELRAGYRNRQYTNNRPVTRFRDRDELEFGATFKYMIMPATSLLVEGYYTDFNYDTNEGQLDSHEYRLLAGVDWKATAITSGFAKVGWQKKVFDASIREEGNASSWEVGIEWLPLTYSKLTLSSSHLFIESNGTGDYIDRRDAKIAWKHAWRDYLSSTLYVDKAKERYEGVIRDDDITGFGLQMDYSMNAYIDWQLHFAHTKRDSSVSGEGLGYRRNLVGLVVNFAL